MRYLLWMLAPAAAAFAALAAALLQSAPLYWPGPGYLLAAMSSLPLALLACRRSLWSALIAAMAATLLLQTKSPAEAAVFILTTAPLGITVGFTTRDGWPGQQAALLAAMLLFAGMLVLQTVADVQPLAPWWPYPLQTAAMQALVYGAFVVVYSRLWVWGFRRGGIR